MADKPLTERLAFGKKQHVPPAGAAPRDTTSPSAKKAARAKEIVQAAYELIAEKGFEGLRTREIAARVEINSATLHYYFPTKEALIGAVVEYLMQELQRSRVPVDAATPALNRLRAEFDDIRFRLKDNPEQLLVLTELTLRAWRDPVIAGLLAYLDEGWKGHLVSIFEAGIVERTFRPDLDVSETAKAMMSQLLGLIYQGKRDPAEVDRMVQHMALQTEYWVRGERKRK